MPNAPQIFDFSKRQKSIGNPTVSNAFSVFAMCFFDGVHNRQREVPIPIDHAIKQKHPSPLQASRQMLLLD
jgi:hypothetical protein